MLIARDAAGQLLIAAGRARLHAPRPWNSELVAHHRIFDVFADLLVGVGLVVMRSRRRRSGNLRSGAARPAAAACASSVRVSNFSWAGSRTIGVVHGRSWCFPWGTRLSYRVCGASMRWCGAMQLPVMACHMLSSNNCTFSACRMSVASDHGVVDGDAAAVRRQRRAHAGLRLGGIEPHRVGEQRPQIRRRQCGPDRRRRRPARRRRAPACRRARRTRSDDDIDASLALRPRRGVSAAGSDRARIRRSCSLYSQPCHGQTMCGSSLS